MLVALADELVLPGRRIVPVGLLELGFEFRFPMVGAAFGETCADR